MKDVTQHTGTLELIERLPNSPNGNPRYLVRLDGQTARTIVDSSEAYGDIPNNFGKRVTAELGTHYGKTHIRRVRRLEQ